MRRRFQRALVGPSYAAEPYSDLSYVDPVAESGGYTVACGWEPGGRKAASGVLIGAFWHLNDRPAEFGRLMRTRPASAILRVLRWIDQPSRL